MIDAVNRVVLLLLGLLLVAAGVVVCLAASGALLLRQPSQLYGDVTAAVQARPGLWLPLCLVVLALLAVLGLVWAARQLVVRAPSGRRTATLEQGQRGRTTVKTTALGQALAADLRGIPGVRRATARVDELRPVPDVRADVRLPADARLPSVQARVDAALERLAGAVGTERLHAVTHYRLSRSDTPRVR